MRGKTVGIVLFVFVVYMICFFNIYDTPYMKEFVGKAYYVALPKR